MIAQLFQLPLEPGTTVSIPLGAALAGVMRWTGYYWLFARRRLAADWTPAQLRTMAFAAASVIGGGVASAGVLAATDDAAGLGWVAAYAIFGFTWAYRAGRRAQVEILMWIALAIILDFAVRGFLHDADGGAG